MHLTDAGGDVARKAFEAGLTSVRGGGQGDDGGAGAPGMSELASGTRVPSGSEPQRAADGVRPTATGRVWPRVMSGLLVALAVLLFQPQVICRLLPALGAGISCPAEPGDIAKMASALALWAAALVLSALSAYRLHRAAAEPALLVRAARSSFMLAVVAPASLACELSVGGLLFENLSGLVTFASQMAALPLALGLPLAAGIMALVGSRGDLRSYARPGRPITSFALFALAVAAASMAALLLFGAALGLMPSVVLT